MESDRLIDDVIADTSVSVPTKAAPELKMPDVDGWNDDTVDLSLSDAGNASLAINFPEGLSPFEKLEWWFAYLKTANVDIISQLGGSSALFFIHAESLILKFGIDPRLRSDYNTTPQFLRLVFYIENFLSVIRQCGGTFCLVFFDSFKPLLEAVSPSLAVLRETFLLSCQLGTNSEALEYAVFPCFRDSKFRDYVEEWQPPFILIEDGSSLRRGSVSCMEETNPIFWGIPYALIHTVLSLDIHVALFYDIRSKGRKIYCFCASPPVLATVSDAAMEVMQTSAGHQAESSAGQADPVVAELLSNFGAAKERANGFCHIGFRDYLIALFFQESIKVDEADGPAEENRQLVTFFCKLLLITSQLCRLLPLKSRALLGFEFPVNDDGESLWGFGDTIDLMSRFFFTEIKHYLEAFTRLGYSESAINYVTPNQGRSKYSRLHGLLENYWESKDIIKELADFADCRLLKILAVLTIQEAEAANLWVVHEEFFNLPKSVGMELNALLESVDVGCFFPVHLHAIRHHLTGSLLLQPRTLADEDRAEPTLLALRSPFFQRLMGTEDRKGYEYGNIPRANITMEPSLLGLKFWKQGMGASWAPSLLLDVAEFQIIHKLGVDNLADFVNEEYLERFQGAQKEKMRRKMKLRIAQKGASRVHKFGASLGAPSRYHHSIKVTGGGQHVWAALPEAVEVTSPQLQLGEGTANKKEKVNAKTASKANKNANKPGNDGVKKQSSKAEVIIKKNEELQRLKVLEADKERLPTTLATIASIGHKYMRPRELCNKILDVLVGPLRFTEEILTFSALKGFLTLPESQCQVLICIVELLNRAVVKQYTRDEVSKCATLEEEMHSFLCFTFQFVHQVFQMYSSVLTGEDVKKLQQLLIALGFVESATGLYSAWRTAKVLRSVAENSTSAARAESSKEASRGGGKKSREGKKQQSTERGGVNEKGAIDQKMLQAVFVQPNSVVRSPFSIPAGFENEIQMKFMGHQMRRSLGSAPDPRVKFNPDQWQVRVLNAIDEKRSTLVCAPTGCGKTFVCYYAMEKVLTWDNESVCVFVCPSKALVQQVQHEVNARFSSKEYPSNCHTQLVGVLLPQIDEKALKCQILLTLPSMFEMLLMSSRYRSWVARLKYVILDEIHCIGEGNEEGRAWERLIQLIPCPFIALSATVGNPGSFHQWLSNAHISGEGTMIRQDGKPPVEIITFSERYADLNYYVYVSESEQKDTEMAGERGGLIPLNPLVCVTYKQINYEGIAKDFYLPTGDLLKAYSILRDLLQTYYGVRDDGTSESVILSQLSACQRNEVVLFITLMHPRHYFKNTSAISKRQYRYYLHWFTNCLTDMVQSGILNESLFNRFIDSLVVTEPLRKRGEVLGGTLWNPRIETAPLLLTEDTEKLATEKTDDATVAPRYQSQIDKIITKDTGSDESFHNETALLEFCRKLHGLGLLPALMFNFSQAVVTHLFGSFFRLLVELQTKKYYGTPEAAAATRAINKKKMDDYKALVRHHEMMEKLKTVSKRTREEEGITVDASDTSPLPPPPIDIADEYDEEFNFSNRRVWGTHYDEIEEIINGVSQRLRKKEAFYAEALRRGIGFHHGGLGRRYRAAVEMLFRMGFLRIVFSTKTLSLGVNMPCKATVFLGDSVQLTPLLFRQTSGRAGRRGFDVLGHVVFWEMPFPKIRRLICARLPVLSGEFTVTPTDVMRTYQLINTVEATQRSELVRQRSSARATDVKKMELDFAQDKALLQNCLLRLYRTPLLSVSTVDAEENLDTLVRLRWAIKYAFRFAANFARHYNYLDSNARCIGLAGLTTFIYTEEPGNLGLAAALFSGAAEHWLNRPVEPSEILPTDRTTAGAEFVPWMTRRLIALIAYFIAPVPVNYNAYLRMLLANDIDPLLPPLSAELKEAISSYNEMALNNAKDYVRCLASSVVKWDKEMRLPATGTDFADALSSGANDEHPVAHRVLGGRLDDMVVPCSGRSPFAALCGRSDNDFTSAYELCNSKPQEVYFEEELVAQVIPSLVTHNGKERPLLSNYALHFFTYKSERRTAENSCVDINDLWQALTRFETALWSITTYVERATQPREGQTESAAAAFLGLLKEAKLAFEQFKKAEAAI